MSVHLNPLIYLCYEGKDPVADTQLLGGVAGALRHTLDNIRQLAASIDGDF